MGGGGSIARLAPYVLFGAYGGVLADRYERTLVMITSDLVRAGLMLGMAVLAAAEGSVVVMVALATLLTTATTPYMAATEAMTPRVIGENDSASRRRHP